MTTQQTFIESVEIELPDRLPCLRHGWFDWRCYYEDWEILNMLDEQGFVDCPLCLAECVGIE